MNTGGYGNALAPAGTRVNSGYGGRVRKPMISPLVHALVGQLDGGGFQPGGPMQGGGAMQPDLAAMGQHNDLEAMMRQHSAAGGNPIAPQQDQLARQNALTAAQPRPMPPVGSPLAGAPHLQPAGLGQIALNRRRRQFSQLGQPRFQAF